MATDEDGRPRFEVGLFECGDWRSCLCAWACCPCALASARSHLDDSAYVFNLACLPVCCSITPVRWMIRTAYDIPGDGCSDLLKSVFCPCCVLNQLLQTSFARGNSTSVGGSHHNVRDFTFYFGTCAEECRHCIFGNLCCPCAQATSLKTALGMPYFFGCCCVTPCAARNIIRYQYRLRGDDLMEEFCGPIAGIVALYGVFVTPLVVIPVISSYSSQCYNEAIYRGQSAYPKYLVAMNPRGFGGGGVGGYNSIREEGVAAAVGSALATDVTRGDGADTDDRDSEISSAFSLKTGGLATGDADKDHAAGRDSDEVSPLLGDKPRVRGARRAILEGTAVDSISLLAAVVEDGDYADSAALGYQVAKLASSRHRNKYVEAEVRKV